MALVADCTAPWRPRGGRSATRCAGGQADRNDRVARGTAGPKRIGGKEQRNTHTPLPAGRTLASTRVTCVYMLTRPHVTCDALVAARRQHLEPGRAACCMIHAPIAARCRRGWAGASPRAPPGPLGVPCCAMARRAATTRGHLECVAEAEHTAAHPLHAVQGDLPRTAQLASEGRRVGRRNRSGQRTADSPADSMKRRADERNAEQEVQRTAGHEAASEKTHTKTSNSGPQITASRRWSGAWKSRRKTGSRGSER